MSLWCCICVVRGDYLDGQNFHAEEDNGCSDWGKVPLGGGFGKKAPGASFVIVFLQIFRQMF